METVIRIAEINNRSGAKADTSMWGMRGAQAVRNFHRSFPEYDVTSLKRLKSLAELFGVQEIYVKDESTRFSLNAFKVLGGCFAVAGYIAGLLGEKPEDMSFRRLMSDEVRQKIKGLTLITTTDGNHGRGVAWVAKRLGLDCVVYMPKGSTLERLDNIKALGARASITDLSYDDTVRMTRCEAEENGWALIQDTSWPGYEQVPSWIMRGYTTIGAEIYEQLSAEGLALPTHIFLQAGVGSMAGAMAAFFIDLYESLGVEKPIITVVEPVSADCVYKTAAADDGALHAVKNPMTSMMAGLCCGEVCPLAWELLESCADFAAAITDDITANGMRILANPLPGDEKIISGESGASGFSLAAALLRDKRFAEIKEKLGVNADSRILCISTEGDTDRENYRRIVWDGADGAAEE